MLLLTARNVAPYLLERGLLSPESWVDGDLRIVEVRRRCRSFKVLAGELPGCFVKQIPDTEADSRAALEREAACLWLAREDPGLACLAPLLPRFRDFDPTHHILVAELLHPSASLAALQFQQDASPALAALWGEGLGILHRATAETFSSRPRSALFPGALPAFLTAHRGEAPTTGREWTPTEHVLAAVRGNTGFPAALEALCADWRPTCLIHGDLRWDNVLVLEGRGEEEAALRLVDWELADYGDPAWDAGCVLESYLAAWILSLPAESGLGSEQLVERAGHPLERIQPAVHAFWHAYSEAAEIALQDRLPRLERALRFAAARMVQTAYESARQERHPLPRVLALLQVSLNVLASPGGAREELLGL